MKKLFIAIIVLAVIFAGAPFFIGSTVETQLREQIEKSNANPSFDISLKSYQKGWFNSYAEIEVAMQLPEAYSGMISDNKITITQDMQHGPLVTKANGMGLALVDALIEIKLPAELQSELDQLEGLEKDLLLITSRTGFNLDNTTYLELKPFSINKEGVALDIKPANGVFSYTLDGQINGQMTWNGLTISEESNSSVELSKLTIETDQQLISGDIFTPSALFNGYFTTSIDLLEITGPSEAEKVSMNALKLNVKSDINDKLANFGFVVDVKTLQAIEQSFKDVSLDISFDNLDTPTLTTMNEFMTNNQGQDPMAAAAKMQELLPQLLKHQPLLKINKLGVTTESGDIDSNLQVSINQDIYDPNNPMTMMVALDAEAKGNAPEAFFTNLGMAATIEEFVNQNLLVREQQNLTFNFSFKNGQALLNGNPMPLGM